MATNEKWEIAIGLSDYVWHRKEENKEGNEAVFLENIQRFDWTFPILLSSSPPFVWYEF